MSVRGALPEAKLLRGGSGVDTADGAYRAALDFLNRFVDYEKGMPHAYSPVIFNLARTARLLDGLGRPEEAYPCLLIAGTKGKGSTAAFLESMLRASGLRTGLYTSPHLHTWRERIQIDRKPIPKEEVASWIERLKPLVEEMSLSGDHGPPTYYEISTALALGYFAAQGVDVAVLEVGLGGRLDATNVVRPRVSVLTTIGYDHMAILGSTLDRIAGEKAGIIKPGGWAVSAPQHPEAMAVFESVCRQQRASLWVAEGEQVRRAIPAGPSLSYPFAVETVPLGLRGGFQRTNARVSVAVLLALQEQGWAFAEGALRHGLETARWPGRLEVVEERPWLILDGAHNIDSARALRAALEDFPCRARLLVVGFSRGHDVPAFLGELAPSSSHLIACASRHPRALAAEDVAGIAAQATRIPVEVAPSVAAALERARALASPDDLICVTGSLFVVAEAREACGLAEETD